jgi:hypothetical protein
MLVVLMLLGAACGGDSSTSPSGQQLAGNYTGTLASNSSGFAQIGVGTLHATLAQNGGSLNGSWTTTYTNAAYNNAGSLTGSVSGSSVTLTLTSGVTGLCPSKVTAAISGTTLSGTYATFDCSFTDGGQFNVTKQ